MSPLLTLTRDYCDLFPRQQLRPADLANIGVGLARSLDSPGEDLAGWYRSLGLALFERFGLTDLPQRRVFAEAMRGSDLVHALGAVENPGRRDPLGRAWMLRSRLLSLPELGEGVLEGHPFVLAFGRSSIPEPLRPMAEQLAEALLHHAHAAHPIAEQIDRSIVALWGCPLERLDAQATAEELETAGLKIQRFEP